MKLAMNATNDTNRKTCFQRGDIVDISTQGRPPRIAYVVYGDTPTGGKREYLLATVEYGEVGRDFEDGWTLRHIHADEDWDFSPAHKGDVSQFLRSQEELGIYLWDINQGFFSREVCRLDTESNQNVFGICSLGNVTQNDDQQSPASPVTVIDKISEFSVAIYDTFIPKGHINPPDIYSRKQIYDILKYTERELDHMLAATRTHLEEKHREELSR